MIMGHELQDTMQVREISQRCNALTSPHQWLVRVCFDYLVIPSIYTRQCVQLRCSISVVVQHACFFSMLGCIFLFFFYAARSTSRTAMHA